MLFYLITFELWKSFINIGETLNFDEQYDTFI